MSVDIQQGDALYLLDEFRINAGRERVFDLVVTDPPYAFGGSGNEHALSATIAVVLRETAQMMVRGSWMVVFAASSWRSTSYMVEAVRGVLEPVRVGVWTKPESRTRVSGPGWQWANVFAIALRKGKSNAGLAPSELLDHIEAPIIRNGRRAELPPEVADWAVAPFALSGGTFLDPFAGSGALVEAASRAGMKAVGFEKHVLSPDQEKAV